MCKPPDYEGIEKNLWKQNASQVQQCLKDQDEFILKRIETFSWRFDFDIVKVKNKILHDQLFAAHFTKEPRRQKLHENIAAQWLQTRKEITNFENLPTSGTGAWYITSDGDLRNNMTRAPTKSLDFKWQTGKYIVYAAHKYTRESGGNQDSQFMEVKKLLEFFQKGSVNHNIIFLAIVDGPYFTQAKMQDLHRFERVTHPVSKALPIEKVPIFLNNHLNKEA